MNALVIIGESPNVTELTGGIEPATYATVTAVKLIVSPPPLISSYS